MNNKNKATKKRDVSELTKMEALIRQNKSIKNGHLIRQSMKYHYASISDWCKPKLKPSTNSFKIASDQQLEEEINKCIPTIKGINQEDFKAVWVKKALFDWIERTYHPTIFMTIQLPNQLKTDKMELSKEHLRCVMAYFEKQLLGREWNQHHLPFICFMEEGVSGYWHFHILFNQGKFKPWHLWLALDNTVCNFDWPDYSMHLDVMNADKRRVISYCFKEVNVNTNGHFDSNRFIFSDELFKLCN